MLPAYADQRIVALSRSIRSDMVPAFRREAVLAIAALPVVGEGNAYRVIGAIWATYFEPPPSNELCGRSPPRYGHDEEFERREFDD